tara:strand:- start:218 stop:376 length:159 start_codon:yes stop_codon:yes gene_type:complete
LASETNDGTVNEVKACRMVKYLFVGKADEMVAAGGRSYDFGSIDSEVDECQT